jgi:hypothetical protein
MLEWAAEWTLTDRCSGSYRRSARAYRAVSSRVVDRRRGAYPAAAPGTGRARHASRAASGALVGVLGLPTLQF